MVGRPPAARDCTRRADGSRNSRSSKSIRPDSHFPSTHFLFAACARMISDMEIKNMPRSLSCHGKLNIRTNSNISKQKKTLPDPNSTLRLRSVCAQHQHLTLPYLFSSILGPQNGTSVLFPKLSCHCDHCPY